MASRESINRVRIEGWRASRVPIDPTVAFYQGDFLLWDASNHVAIKSSTAPSGSLFLGMSDTKNPIETAGSTSFLSDSSSPRLNVIQQGLVEGIWAGGATTLYPFTAIYLEGSDAQKIAAAGNGVIGIADPAYGAAGKAVVNGDLVRFWLRVPDAYRTFF